MQTKNLQLDNFNKKKKSFLIKKYLKKILNEKNHVIDSLQNSYKDKYNKKIISKYQKYKNISIIGMGGSILGSKAIYNFLYNKIKKKFFFIDNLKKEKFETKFKEKKLNLIISKSGNTLETLSNANILIKKKIKIYLSLIINKVI